jgi:hypothetical protein
VQARKSTPREDTSGQEVRACYGLKLTVCPPELAVARDLGSWAWPARSPPSAAVKVQHMTLARKVCTGYTKQNAQTP